MNKQTEQVLKMAIEALEDALTRFSTFNEMQHDAIQACIDALEQPAQDPVAYIYQNNAGYPSLMWNPLCVYEYESITLKQPKIPLYTHPHQWQGLTDDEIHNVADTIDNIEYACEYINVIEFSRAIEKKIKEKNK